MGFKARAKSAKFENGVADRFRMANEIASNLVHEYLVENGLSLEDSERRLVRRISVRLVGFEQIVRSVYNNPTVS